jgi:hypothetical protein
MAISCQVSPASLQGVLAGYCQTVVVDGSGMFRNQTGNAQLISNGQNTKDALCDTTV